MLLGVAPDRSMPNEKNDLRKCAPDVYNYSVMFYNPW